MSSDTDNDSKSNTPTSGREVHRTIRTLAVVVGFAYCIHKICDTVAKLSDQPVWLTLTLAVLSAIGAGGLPSLLLWLWFRNITLKRVSRMSELESQVDCSRSSSGVSQDGGHGSDS